MRLPTPRLLLPLQLYLNIVFESFFSQCTKSFLRIWGKRYVKGSSLDNNKVSKYVPEPKPVHSKYQVGVYYYPGWKKGTTLLDWELIKPYAERKPLLGWYNEGNPEVADWHIKWAVEHGISFFIYDWYWEQSSRILEHALHNGFQKAKYRSYIKYCLLWANHPYKVDPSIPYVSSKNDLINLTNFCIRRYFRDPEYLRVQDKPLFLIFMPERLTKDMGSDGVKDAFQEMRKVCRDDGLGGLYIVACVGEGDLNALKSFKEEGYDAVSAYTWPRVGMRNEELEAPYDNLIKRYDEIWRFIVKRNIIKLIPPISAGWDSRPWAVYGWPAMVRYGINPEKFKQHCEDAKRVLDEMEQEPKLRMIFIEAWNEWGEGSYIEPHAQFGFGYLDAIREVFTRAPKKHLDLKPEDIGLGPYEG